jgi:dGTPase
MDWNRCYSAKRILTMEDESTDGHRSPFSRDADRIIFSNPFRRLQDKTQIFSLPGSAFVHNRLTHSLEVAAVGRSLGAICGNRLVEEKGSELNRRSREFYQRELSEVIYAACLAHDIGNPAFGHSGEDAISTYFKNNRDKEFNQTTLRSCFSEKEWADLINFEGNANAIRILAGTRNGRPPWELNPTITTVATLAKYPCEATGSQGKSAAIHRKKFGFLQSESHLFHKAATELGMLRESENPLIYRRHPFVFLLEAADDICYTLVDLEDAARLGIISSDYVGEIMGNLLHAAHGERDPKTSGTSMFLKAENDPEKVLSYLRSKCIGMLIQGCADAFLRNSDALIKGELNKPLIELINPHNVEELKAIKKLSVEKIYYSDSVVRMEIAGYRIFSELLELMVPAVLAENPDGQEKKTLKMIPATYRPDPSSTPYEKMICIVDYLSSMTDNYALELYRNAAGIELPRH